jgi:uncharacterized protein
MRDHIIEVLKQIEVDYDVKILYACESGSRAWGFPKKGSDFDVRFVYIHKKNWYLSIDQKRDVIEIPKHDFISIPIHELLDMSGWELTKALKLLRKSNPPLLEWLDSNIVYYQAYSTIEKMRAISLNIFAPNTCLHHYLNMAKGNFRDCIKDKEIKVKKYLNVFRPLLAGRWIEQYNSIPPIEFQKLLEGVIQESPLKKCIDNLLKQKIEGEVVYSEPNIERINTFVGEEIVRLETYTKTLNIEISDPTELLNQLFRETLEEVWK